MKSLAARVALFVFIVEIVVLALFGLAARAIAQGALIEAFDSSLRANAEALANVTEVERDGAIEFEIGTDVMARFTRGEHPDIFAIRDAAGKLVAKSEPFGEVPARAVALDEGTSDFDFRNAPYRGIMLNARTKVDAEDEIAAAPIRVFFAASRVGLDGSLARVNNRLAGGLLLACVLSALLAALVARHGLRGLNHFAGAFDRVTPENLGSSFDVDSYPKELQGPAAAFNRLAERLKQAFARERQFSADAAHELRTPVAALKVAIQAAQRSPGHSGENTELLDDLEAEAKRLELLCENLLIASSSSPDAQAASMSAEEWLREVQSAIDSMQDNAREKGSALSLSVSEELPRGVKLSASPAVTHRILTNLITNAAVHGGEGVRIDVSVRPCPGCVEVIVEDNGAGIPAHLRERVFERFFRADTSRSRASGGAGLGLAISRHLARSQGGDLILNGKDDHGARFVWKVVPG